MKNLNNRICLVIITSILLNTVSVFAQTNLSSKYPQLLFPSFEKGTIKLKSGKTNTAMLDYNTVDEEMLFEQNSSFFIISRPGDVDTVYLNNKKFVPIDQAFYEVINSGTLSLFIQHKNKFAPMPSKSAYGLTSQTNGPTAVTTVRGGGQVRFLEMPENMTLSPATTYWARLGDHMYKFSNEKQFIKIIPGKTDEIKEFIKNSRIDIKSAEGLLKLGNFCNHFLVNELMK
jgi:hypothetical protein